MKLNDPIRMPEVNLRLVLGVLAGLLGVFDIVLLIKLGMAVFTAHSVSAQEMQARQLQLKAQEMEVQPLRGLDRKLADSTLAADKFYADRLPSTYSAVAAELGHLAKESGVTLSRVGNAPKEAGAGLTVLRMDSSLTGDYAPLMKFINAMERDKMFFVVRGIALSGQQGGLVNLRLTSDTYLRETTADDIAAQAAADPANAPAPDQPNAGGEQQ